MAGVRTLPAVLGPSGSLSLASSRNSTASLPRSFRERARCFAAPLAVRAAAGVRSLRSHAAAAGCGVGNEFSGAADDAVKACLRSRSRRRARLGRPGCVQHSPHTQL
jgi:hypothetical protein